MASPVSTDDGDDDLWDSQGFTGTHTTFSVPSGLDDTLLTSGVGESCGSSSNNLLNLPRALDADLEQTFTQRPQKPTQAQKQARSAHQRAFFAQLRTSTSVDDSNERSVASGAAADVSGEGCSAELSALSAHGPRPKTSGHAGARGAADAGSDTRSSPSSAGARSASQRRRYMASQPSIGETMYLTGAWDLNDTVHGLRKENGAGRSRNAFLVALGQDDSGSQAARGKGKGGASSSSGRRSADNERSISRRSGNSTDPFGELPSFLESPVTGDTGQTLEVSGGLSASGRLSAGGQRERNMYEFDRVMGTGGLDAAVVAAGMSFNSAGSGALLKEIQRGRKRNRAGRGMPRVDRRVSSVSTASGELVLENAFFQINKDDKKLPKHNLKQKMIGERSKEQHMFMSTMGDEAAYDHAGSLSPTSNATSDAGSPLARHGDQRNRGLREQALAAAAGNAQVDFQSPPQGGDGAGGGTPSTAGGGTPASSGTGVSRPNGILDVLTQDVAAVVQGDVAMWEAARKKAREKAAKAAEDRKRTKKKRKRRRPPPEVILRVVAAIAPYCSGDASEVALSEGDVVQVLEEDETGWMYGRLVKSVGADNPKGTRGWFPCTFVADHDPDDEESNAKASAGATRSRQGSPSARVAKAGASPSSHPGTSPASSAMKGSPSHTPSSAAGTLPPVTVHSRGGGSFKGSPLASGAVPGAAGDGSNQGVGAQGQGVADEAGTGRSLYGSGRLLDTGDMLAGMHTHLTTGTAMSAATGGSTENDGDTIGPLGQHVFSARSSADDGTTPPSARQSRSSSMDRGDESKSEGSVPAGGTPHREPLIVRTGSKKRVRVMGLTVDTNAPPLSPPHTPPPPSSEKNARAARSMPHKGNVGSIRWLDKPPELEAQVLSAPTVLVALCAYKAEDDNELSFKPMDRLVLVTDDGSGWVKGRHLGQAKEGWFPAACVQELGESESYDDADAILSTPAHLQDKLDHDRQFMTRHDAANFFRTHGPVVAVEGEATGVTQPGTLQGMKMKGSDRVLLKSGLASPREGDSKTSPAAQRPRPKFTHQSASAKGRLSGALAAVKRVVTRSVRSLRFRHKSARVIDASTVGAKYTPTSAAAAAAAAARGPKSGWAGPSPLANGGGGSSGGVGGGDGGLPGAPGDAAVERAEAPTVAHGASPGVPEVDVDPVRLSRQPVDLGRITSFASSNTHNDTSVSHTASLGDNDPKRRNFAQPKKSPARVMIPGMGSRVNSLRGATGGSGREGGGRRGMFLAPLSSRAHLLNTEPASVLTPSGVNVMRLPSSRRVDSTATVPDGTAKFIISQLPPARRGRGSTDSASMRISLPSNDDISDADVLGRSTSRS